MAHLILKFELGLRLLLSMRVTIVPEVDSTTFSEKQVLESLLPLALADLLDGFNLALSAIKHVSMVRNLGLPESLVFFGQIFILSFQFYQNTLHHRLELLICHRLCFLKHVLKVLIKTVSDVGTTFAWRLNTELNAMNVSSNVTSCKHYVTKLFNRT